MASKRKVLSDYTKKNLPKYEQEYAERTGSLVGFTKSPEYKRFKRNRKKTEYRYVAKVRDKKIAKKISLINIEILENPKSVNDKLLPDAIQEIDETTTIDGILNFEVMEDNRPFWTVLSYGKSDEKASIEYYRLSKKIGGGVTAIIDDTEINGGVSEYNNMYDYQIAIMELFKDCKEEQVKLGNSAGPTISIATATVNGRETIWVKVQSQSTWQKPQPRKKRQNPKQ